jgi:NAD(P)-dependent dehydrogenase (short-subunit alcohol dehydrogenase family)
MAGADVTDPSDSDRVVVLTGATSGIGRVATTDLASRGATVAAIGRNRDRGERLADRSSDLAGMIRFHRADLATQRAVRDLATDLLDSYDRIDVLAHNAGLSAGTRGETPDGIERTLAVNHLAPYLLTHELLDRLVETPPSRIVVTASDIHRRATLDFDDLQFTSEYDSLQAYARSKLANIAFTLELADRLSGTQVTANCFHPGFVPSTNLFREAPLRTRLAVRAAALVPGVGTTQQDGADRLLRLATAPEYETQTGQYVGGDGPLTPDEEARDQGVRDRLWEVSADLVGVDADWP